MSESRKMILSIDNWKEDTCMSVGPSHKVVDTSRHIIMNLDSGAHSLKSDTWFKIERSRFLEEKNNMIQIYPVFMLDPPLSGEAMNKLSH